MSRGFVVLTTQRSGSTWLLSRLRNLAEAGAAISVGEELPLRAFLAVNASRIAPTSKKWPSVINAVFEELGCSGLLSVESENTPKKRLSSSAYYYQQQQQHFSFGGRNDLVCGFKIMYFQIHEDALSLELTHSLLDATRMKRDSIKLIHLIRRSHIRRELSRWRARSTGVWHGPNHSSLCDQQRGILTPERLATNVIKSVTRIALYRSLFSQHSSLVYQLYYEDLLPTAKESNQTFEDLVRFVDPKLLPYVDAVAPLSSFLTEQQQQKPCFDACVLDQGRLTPWSFISALNDASSELSLKLKQLGLSSYQSSLALAELHDAIQDCQQQR